jgi:hypothetical protein
MIGARMADMHSSRQGTEKEDALARDPRGLLALVCVSIRDGGTNVGKTVRDISGDSARGARRLEPQHVVAGNARDDEHAGPKGCAARDKQCCDKTAGCRALLSETEETLIKRRAAPTGTRRPRGRAPTFVLLPLGAALGASSAVPNYCCFNKCGASFPSTHAAG